MKGFHSEDFQLWRSIGPWSCYISVTSKVLLSYPLDFHGYDKQFPCTI